MSVASKIVELILSLSGASREISEKRFYKEMRKSAVQSKKERDNLPVGLGVRVEKGVYCGMRYFVFVPPQVECAKSVLYIHGSGYVNPYCTAQIRFASGLAKNTHAKVFFPLYPKLPFVTAAECFALLFNYFAFLQKKGEVCLVGDSSGGALALALAAERKTATTVVAVSPWLRLSIGEEGRTARCDKFLSLSKLQYAATIWRGDLDEKDVRVSPFYADFKGKRILLFAGEYERFCPDAADFFREQSMKGAKIEYEEGREQQHCYPLFPTPEGKRARERIYREVCHFLYGRKK